MDIAIIGGGPAGLYLAQLLKNEYDVRVFEEHSSVGMPAHCTGLVTKDVLNFVNGNVVLNRIKGAHIHALNEMITVEKKDYAAYVIDRPLFDKYIYENVRENVLLNMRVKGIEIKGVKYLVKSKDEYESKILVGADGARSFIRGMVYNKKIPLLNGVQFSIKSDEYLGDYVHIFLDRKYSQGFFSWLVPREDDVLAGLATYDNHPLERMRSFLRHVSPNAEIKEKFAGQIPIGTLPFRAKNNLFLTGDAALFIKATSGGGLYYGLTGSKILAKSIIERSSYEKNISGIVKELKRDYIIHKIFSRLNDVELSKIISLLKEESLIQTINEYGDIDRPSILAKKLIFNKKTIPFYPLFFSAFLKSFFF